jgi:cyanophycin synthetase
LISISGTNGKSTTTRMITHIARLAGRHVGTTTTDGVLIDERVVEPGDFTGPQGARAVLNHPEVDLAVLETARGGILLRGLGYQSNDVSVLTNVSGDHLDLQGLHTLPELAEVKSVICRVTVPGGTVVLNADDSLVAAVAARVHATVVLFSERNRGARLRRHLARGGRAFVREGGWLVELAAGRRRQIVPTSEIPAALGGLARHNVANALAAAALTALAGVSLDHVRAALERFEPPSMRMQVERLANGITVINDAYNANPASMAAALHTLAASTASRRLAVLGEMRELGSEAEAAHAELGRIVAGARLDLLVVLGPHAALVRDGALAAGMTPERIVVASDHADAGERLRGFCRRGDLVLLKGSRGAALESVLAHLAREDGA